MSEYDFNFKMHLITFFFFKISVQKWKTKTSITPQLNVRPKQKYSVK